MPRSGDSGVSRTSSLTAQGRVALQELQQATPSCSGPVGPVELFAGVGGPRRAMEHCGVVPSLHIAVGGEAGGQRVLRPLERHAATDRRKGPDSPLPPFVSLCPRKAPTGAHWMRAVRPAGGAMGERQVKLST